MCYCQWHQCSDSSDTESSRERKRKKRRRHKKNDVKSKSSERERKRKSSKDDRKDRKKNKRKSRKSSPVQLSKVSLFRAAMRRTFSRLHQAGCARKQCVSDTLHEDGAAYTLSRALHTPLTKCVCDTQFLGGRDDGAKYSSVSGKKVSL